MTVFFDTVVININIVLFFVRFRHFVTGTVNAINGEAITSKAGIVNTINASTSKAGFMR